MFIKSHLFIGISLVLVLTLAACSSATPTPGQPGSSNASPTSAADPATAVPTSKAAPTTAPTAVPTIKPAPASAGACSNPYFPLKTGATWTYANTSPMVGDSTTTRTLVISATGFTTQDATTPDINVNVNWSCKDGNLTQQATDSKTAISAKNIKIDSTTVNATGYFLPAVLMAGQTWSEKLALVSTGTIGKQKMIQSNTTQIDCKAGGQESVQVPAGKFDAMKVTCAYAITSVTSVEGVDGSPVTINITVDDWYVSGVGSVKTVKSGDISETHTLTSYKIP